MKHSSPFVHLYECCIQEELDAEYYHPRYFVFSLPCLHGIGHWSHSLRSESWYLCHPFLFPFLDYKECCYWLTLLVLIFLILFAYYDPMLLLLLQQSLGLQLKLQLGTLKMLLQVGVFGASSTTYHPTLKIKRLTMYVWFHFLYFFSTVTPMLL